MGEINMDNLQTLFDLQCMKMFEI